MKNKTSKRIKLLIGAVLALFFIVVVSDMAPDFLSGFKAGLKAGTEQQALAANPPMIATIEQLDPYANIKLFEGGERFQTHESSGVVTIPGNGSGISIWYHVAKGLLGLLALISLAAFLINVAVFAIRFPRRHVMACGNIVSLRWIAGSLGVMGLSFYGVVVMDYLWLRGHVVLEGYRIILSSPPAALIVALILVVLTEILNLAGRLQREQELTI